MAFATEFSLKQLVDKMKAAPAIAPFNWSPSIVETTITGYDDRPITVPAAPFWWPMIPYTNEDRARAAQARSGLGSMQERLFGARGAKGCMQLNAENCTAAYGTDFPALIKQLRDAGYSDATLIYLALVADPLVHWGHGEAEKTGKWPAHLGFVGTFMYHRYLEAAVAAAKRAANATPPKPAPRPWELAEVVTASHYAAKYLFQQFWPQFSRALIDACGTDLAPYWRIFGTPFDRKVPLDRLHTLVQAEGEAASMGHACEAVFEFLRELGGSVRLVSRNELNIVAQLLLQEKGWTIDGDKTLHIYLGAGDITVCRLPNCSSDRVKITLADLCIDGTLAAKDEVLPAIVKRYGDIPQPVVHPVLKAPISTELSSWVKQDAPSLVCWTAPDKVDGLWIYLPDMLEEIDFDLTQINGIDYRREGLWADGGRTWSTVDFKEGSVSWTIAMLTGQRAPTGHARQDAAKRRADRIAGELMADTQLEQFRNGFDDVYGACWMKNEFGVEVESVDTRYQDLPARKQEAFTKWARHAIATDGWAASLGTYDGQGYTSSVITRTVKPVQVIGFAYWRT